MRWDNQLVKQQRNNKINCKRFNTDLQQSLNDNRQQIGMCYVLDCLYYSYEQLAINTIASQLFMYVITEFMWQQFLIENKSCVYINLKESQ